MSRIKRDKRTEKRHGRAADAPRRYSRRKHRLFSKKLAFKLRRVPFLCTICIRNTLSGKKYVLECNHTFHRKCIKQWLETDPRRSCPNCRRYVSPNTGLYQLPSPAVQRSPDDTIRLFLLAAAVYLSRNDDRRPVRDLFNLPRNLATSSLNNSVQRSRDYTIRLFQAAVDFLSRNDYRRRARYLFNLPRNLATSSLNNLVTINIYLDDQSSQLDNSIIQLRSIFSIGLVDPSSNSSDSRTDLPHPSSNLDNRNTDIEDQSSQLDNSIIQLRSIFSIGLVDPSSNSSDSKTDLPHPSPNLDNGNTDIENQSSHLDNSSTHTVDPSSNFSDLRTDLPASSPPNLDNRNVDLDYQSSNLDNSSIHSVGPTSVIRQRISPRLLIFLTNMHLDDQSSHFDNASAHSVDPSSNVIDSRRNVPHLYPNLDNRNTDIEDQSSHFDNSRTHSVDPSSNISDSRTNSPDTYSNSDIPDIELP